VFQLANRATESKQALSIAYHGNIVDLLDYIVDQDIHVDLLSDQTSCHVVYDGGYCPQGISFAERTHLLSSNREQFKKLVDQSLRHHFELIRILVDRDVFFFDYGNAFLKAVFDSGITEVARNGVDAKDVFIFTSYFEDIMGPIFDYGYGPFRWV